MENFVKISAHINHLIGCFGEFFSHASISKSECLKLMRESNLLHLELVKAGDLLAYDKQIELAKKIYEIMVQKIPDSQIVADIMFCGTTKLTWSEVSHFLHELYGIDMHSKEIYAFYYLHEINNKFYIDSPLPERLKSANY